MAGPASSLRESFQSTYGGSAGLCVYRGPGRVNLIGEHTDYNLGFVLPMALDLACFVASAPSGDDLVRAVSESAEERFEADVADLASLPPSGGWMDYVVGVAQLVLRAGYRIEPKNLLIRSTVPVGAGLSSSAALETSTALALLGEQKIEPLELVRLCRRAENEFVGMPCGIMDQYVSVFGRDHAAIRIDCRSLEHEVVPLPDGVAILAVNTLVKHELGQSAYRDRVRECAEAAAALGVPSLRDVDEAQFASAATRIPPVPRKRARHVVTEGARVEAFLAASSRGDLAEMGKLFVASHRSLQHDYEVSCDELDFLVDSALGIAGVYGARMTGGGFGGCTVNLVQPEAVESFQTEIAKQYQARFGTAPQIYRCKPSEGAGEVK